MMTPEGHYHDGEAHLEAAELRAEGGKDHSAAKLHFRAAELHFRAAVAGARMRERWGHDELAKLEGPVDIAERRTARALDAVKAVTVGWAKGQYDDKLDAFDAVRAIVDGLLVDP